MQITPKTIFYAVHSIFESRNVRVGGSLTLDTISKAWPETRLRRLDMGRGLEALSRAGYLAMNRTPFGVEVQLLDNQFARVISEEDRKAMAMFNLVRKLRAPSTVVSVQQSRAPGFGRREGEPATAAV